MSEKLVLKKTIVSLWLKIEFSRRNASRANENKLLKSKVIFYYTLFSAIRTLGKSYSIPDISRRSSNSNLVIKISSYRIGRDLIRTNRSDFFRNFNEINRQFSLFGYFFPDKLLILKVKKGLCLWRNGHNLSNEVIYLSRLQFRFQRFFGVVNEAFQKLVSEAKNFVFSLKMGKYRF